MGHSRVPFKWDEGQVDLLRLSLPLAGIIGCNEQANQF